MATARIEIVFKENDEVVETLDVRDQSQADIDDTLRGLRHQLNHDEYRIDEVDEDDIDGAPCCPAPQDHDTKDGSCDFPGYAANH